MTTATRNSTDPGPFPVTPMHQSWLAELGALSDDWDKHAAKTPTPSALSALRTLLTHLPPAQQARTEIYPTPTGGTLAQWVESGRVLIVEIDPAGAISGTTYDGTTETRSTHTWRTVADVARSLETLRSPSAPAQDDPLAVPLGCAESDSPGVRAIVLFCDRGCGSTIAADIRADTSEQAYAGLRRLATDRGWQVTRDEDLCPTCAGGCTAYREHGFNCGLPAGHDPHQEHVNVKEASDGR